MDTDGERSVRVIVVPVLGIHDAPEEPPSPKPIGRVAVGVAVLGLIAGLWFVARPMPGTDAADQPITEPATTTSISPSSIVDADTPDPFDAGRAFPMPATGLTHVAAFAEGWVGTGEPIAAGGGPTVLTSSDGLTWRAIGDIPDVDRVLQLEWTEDAIRALVAADRPDSSTTLTVVTSTDGITWTEVESFGEIVVEGFAVTGSLLGERWVVAVGQQSRSRITQAQSVGTRLYVGLGGLLSFPIQVDPDEYVESFAATTSGLVATVVRLEITADGSTRAATRLLRWTSRWGIQDVTSLLGSAAGDPDLVARGGRVIAGRRLFEPTVPPEFDFTSSGRFFETEWMPVVTAPDGMPSLRLSLDGRSVMGVAASGGDAYRIALPIDDDEWRAASLESDGPPELVLATDTYAVVRVDADAGRPRLVQLEFARLGEPGEFRVREAVGERLQSLPVLAPSLAGDGFVGLAVENGETLAFATDDGLLVEEPTPTNLPTGFFPIRLEAEASGYHTIGRIGLVRSAAFVSPDGIDWEEIPTPVVADSDRFEIFQVSTHGSSRVLLGARGPAGMTAIETYIQWSEGGSQPVEVDTPCDEAVARCEVSTVSATADGFVAIQSGRDEPGAVFAWRPDSGWSSVPVSLPSVRLRTVGDVTWFLSEDMAGILEDDGSIGGRVVSRPAIPAPGEFVGIGPEATTFVFRTDADLLVGRLDLDVGVEWVAHPVAGIELGTLLALGDDAAVFRAVGEAGPGLMRFPAP